MSQKILAVDDSRSLLQMVEFTLRGAGYEVVGAADGAAALSAAQGQRFDLVVTDVNMPQMDGIELVRRLRALPGYRCTPVLVLTTESGDAAKTAGRAAGATGWLVKPFVPERLLETVRRVLP